MKIAILDLNLQGDLLNGLAREGQVIADWLQPALPKAKLVQHPIAYGASFPDIQDFDGLVIGGSEKGVYDTPEWMEPLRAFLPRVKDAGKPILGICFGHQILADVFGGEAQKSAEGTHVGVREYTIDGEQKLAHAWHGDQVTKVPPNARVTGFAPYCPIAALEYDFPAMSVQFHPEYTRQRIIDHINVGDALIERQLADAALTSLRQDVRQDLMAKESAEFFLAHP